MLALGIHRRRGLHVACGKLTLVAARINDVFSSLAKRAFPGGTVFAFARHNWGMNSLACSGSVFNVRLIALQAYPDAPHVSVCRHLYSVPWPPPCS
jgi:hypothetical protein